MEGDGEPKSKGTRPTSSGGAMVEQGKKMEVEPNMSGQDRGH